MKFYLHDEADRFSFVTLPPALANGAIYNGVRSIYYILCYIELPKIVKPFVCNSFRFSYDTHFGIDVATSFRLDARYHKINSKHWPRLSLVASLKLNTCSLSYFGFNFKGRVKITKQNLNEFI